jgi:hypothetical protein
LKKSRPGIHERKWFAFTGWALGIIVSIIAIIQYVWPTQDKLQREEFISNNRPQLELSTSAFYPENRDPVLIDTELDDTVGITGSYWVINKGKANITLEQISLPKDFQIRGYFADGVVKLPYSLNPNEKITISCKLINNSKKIEETEAALKSALTINCSHPYEIAYMYKFTWDTSQGFFVGSVRVLKE